jgi:hypothetical protein
MQRILIVEDEPSIALALEDERDDGGRELLMVPIDGTKPHTLEFDLKRMAKDFLWLRLSPDGRRLTYMIGDDRLEVWAMENFLSMLK